MAAGTREQQSCALASLETISNHGRFRLEGPSELPGLASCPGQLGEQAGPAAGASSRSSWKPPGTQIQSRRVGPPAAALRPRRASSSWSQARSSSLCACRLGPAAAGWRGLRAAPALHRQQRDTLLPCLLAGVLLASLRELFTCLAGRTRRCPRRARCPHLPLTLRLHRVSSFIPSPSPSSSSSSPPWPGRRAPALRTLSSPGPRTGVRGDSRQTADGRRGGAPCPTVRGRGSAITLFLALSRHSKHRNANIIREASIRHGWCGIPPLAREQQLPFVVTPGSPLGTARFPRGLSLGGQGLFIIYINIFPIKMLR